MQNLKPNDQDEPLARALREWDVRVALPPRFEEEVWGRIARADTGAGIGFWAHFLRWLESGLPRPAVASVYVLMLFTGGLTAGYWESHHKTAQLDQTLGRRYVEMVAPFRDRD